MDKYEYRIRLQEINTLISTRNFQDAAGVADGIDWQRVKSPDTLCRISDVYKINKEYAKSRRLLVLANQRDPQNPEIIYSLCELTLFLYGRDGLQSDLTSALTLMQNYNILQPRSPKRLILQYKMYQVSPVSLDEKIDVLQRLKQESYQPRWVYELALLYHEAGRDEEAIAECRDLENNVGGKFAGRAEQLIQKIESEPSRDPAAAPQPQDDIPTVENSEKQDTDAALQRTVAEGLAQLDEGGETQTDGQDEALPSQEEDAVPAQEPEQEQESKTEENEEADAAPSAATMSISEVMAEWEKIRQSVKDTSEEKVAEKIRQDTGELFHEFEETSRHGLLEDIEKNVEKRHRDARASLENGIAGRGSSRYSSAQQGQGDYSVRRIHAPEIAPEEGAQQADLFANEAPEQAPYEEAPDAGEEAAEQPVNAPETPQESYDSYAQEQEDEDYTEEPVGSAEETYAQENAAPEEYPGAGYPGSGYADNAPGYEEEPDYGTTADADAEEEPAYEENEDGSISTRRWNADAVRRAMDREKKRYEEFEAHEKNHAEEAASVTEEEQEEAPVQEETPVEIPEAAPAAEEESALAQEESSMQEPVEAAEPETPPAFTRRRRRPVRPAAQVAEPAPEEVPAMEQGLSEEESGFPGETAQEEALTPAEEARQLRSRRRRARPVRRPAEELRRQMEEETPAEPAEEEAPVQEEEAAPGESLQGEQVPAEEEAEEAPAREENTGRAPRAPRRPHPVRRPEPEETPAEEEETASAVSKDTHPISASGQRALTESEKKLFGPTCIVPENRRQILNAIDNLSLASYTGNILVTGPEGTAKKVAAGILEITKHSDSNFTGRIAKASGPALNRLSPEKLSATLNQINGGAMIVYNASALEEDTLKNLHSEIEGKERGLIVIFADRKRAMDEFLQEYPDYLKSFTVTVNILPLTDKALVSYGLEYAKSKDYSIDELGQLALSSRISSRQTPDHQVTTKEVRDLVDEAIGWASKKNLHTLMLILTKKRYDQDDRIIIHEKDFQHYEK